MVLLRINAILRRVPKSDGLNEPPKTLQLGEIRYDMTRGEMWEAALEDSLNLLAKLPALAAAVDQDPKPEMLCAPPPTRRRSWTPGWPSGSGSSGCKKSDQ